MRLLPHCLLLTLTPGLAFTQTPSIDFEFGPPPVFTPGKTWQAPQPWPQPEAASVVSVNPNSRYQVSLLYRNQYIAQSSVTNAWTGSISPCNPGSTAQAFQDATINRVNLYRALAGLPGNISEFSIAGGEQIDNQNAALMFAANQQLSHTPPNTWICYTSAGATGAGSSNIALGWGVGFSNNGPTAIDGYMDDSGSNNTGVGHRRWILYPPQTQMADGDVDSTASTSNYSADALWVFGPVGTRPSTPNGVPWPPRGYVPWQLLPAASARWSLSLQNANFNTATVSMSRNGIALSVSIEPFVFNGQPSGSFIGDNTIAWIPSGATYTQPIQDVVYAVTVSGITGSGVPTSVSYTVKVIDPYDAIFADQFE